MIPLHPVPAPDWPIGRFFLLSADPEHSIGREPFLERMDPMCAMMSVVAPVDPSAPVLIPGEPEAAAMADRERNGVPLPREWWIEDIEAMAASRMPKGMPERGAGTMWRAALALPCYRPRGRQHAPHRDPRSVAGLARTRQDGLVPERLAAQSPTRCSSELSIRTTGHSMAR